MNEKNNWAYNKEMTFFDNAHFLPFSLLSLSFSSMSFLTVSDLGLSFFSFLGADNSVPNLGSCKRDCDVKKVIQTSDEIDA